MHMQLTDASDVVSMHSDLSQDPAVIHSSVADFFALLKPRVMSLVVFSGITGLLVAPGTIHWAQAIITIVCIAFGSGAAGAFNMWYDRDIDSVMLRTRSRPIPTKKITPDNALAFSVLVAVFSVLILSFGVSYVAGALLLSAILFYCVIYTMWLKRSTKQNIVIGGAAGAFPPLIGWVAVTGDVSWGALSLFALIFFWTPPHFWSLSLYCKDDYAKANIPMLPVVSGDRITRWYILAYSCLLLPVSLLPFYTNVAGWFYCITAVILTLVLLMLAIMVLLEKPKVKRARVMFFSSILYLFTLFSVLILDRANGVVFSTSL